MESSIVGSLESVASHRWTIENYLGMPKEPGQFHQSPVFFAGPHRFVIVLYPNGSTEESSRYLSCYLKIVSKKPVEVSFRLSVYYSNNAREIVNAKRLLGVPGSAKNAQERWGQTRFLERNENFEHSIRTNGDKLIVICDIFEMDNVTCVCSEIAEHFVNLGNIEHQEPFADVEIVVEGKCFKAHKIVLANASEVFHAMLVSDMKERRSNRIYIDDCESATMESILKYMYSGKPQIGTNEAPEKLWIASDRYGLIKLREYCEEALTQRVTSANLFYYSAFCDVFQAPRLRQKALSLFGVHKKTYIGSPALMEFIQSSTPQMVNDLMAV
ncbi:hypothetical protein QAD02_002603 [Eretmocerus hayati]|uniref:Uncharacterized protein n=1 Tax=Eretmocerus hayati TaxID=131215 RepID=A0ACC2NM16_9HYME|nr:hypothetical protein QAD02_002603 [Eretmocerus hayati]